MGNCQKVKNTETCIKRALTGNVREQMLGVQDVTGA